ncbi:hypothetical protein BH23ACT2_BH23ACT2_21710 [soil metagenome]
MSISLRTRATGAGLAVVLALGAAACGGGSSPEAAAERAIQDAVNEGMDDADVDVDLSEGGFTVEDGESSVAFGAGDLPDGFPSEMPIFDPDAQPIGAVSIVDEGEQRIGVSFQVDASVDEVVGFYQRELPSNGWDVEESDQVSIPVLAVEGYGYTGGVTVADAGGVVTLSFMLERPAG